MLKISVASVADLPVVTALYAEAVEWLGAAGHDQWQQAGGSRQPVAERIVRSVEDRKVYLVREEVRTTQVIATITLDTNADPDLWLEADDPTSALYVHRMIVARLAKGKAIGSSLLDWASMRALRAGKVWLRLDAWATNANLHNYYLGQEFQNVRTLHFPHRGSGALFQRRAGVVLQVGPRIEDVDQG